MAICLSIHLRHDFSEWGNHKRCVEYLKSMAKNLQKAFFLSDNQIEVGAFVDEKWEKEDKAEYDSSRYLIRIEKPLWIDCHLENGFWVIVTCEPYSALFDEGSNTLNYVKQIIRTFGGHTAYVTEELTDWLGYASPEMSLDEWLQKDKVLFVVEI